MKSIVLYGLMALAHASPLPELSKRAKFGDFKCPDGTTLSENDIREAFQECRKHDDSSVSKYPAKFGNKNNNQKIFSNIPDDTDLREFSIIVGGKYTSGVPGKYRVVTDYKDDQGNFRGVMQHTGAATGDAYTACTRVTSPRPETGKDKGDKKGNNKERSVQATEAEIAEESTSHTVNDLATRAKKKKNIGSATCEGTTLSKNDVANAFKGCKKGVNVASAAIRTNSVTRALEPRFSSASPKTCASILSLKIELGLVGHHVGPGLTSGIGDSPGNHRVVTDYKNSFVGVMVEKPGATFIRCTANAD
ncbi:hypothetical protein PENCOP_c017G08568 [Penicillium coprophilum]|uniref:Uncharacterized protein n=1 Tax=Penicillium coprophilum TaxID=36646 RepID=A0A1V6U7X6_9EURO|nr:hypothetical protein PENCOP_c017G08568 [Penicillium coprophilum]